MANKTATDKNQPSRKKLRDNEYFNPKTRRYEYRYKDKNGKVRVVSSYRLEATDQPPKGKRSGLSLREKEVEVLKSLSDGVDIDGANLLFKDLSDRYFNYILKANKLAPGTMKTYSSLARYFRQCELSTVKISKLTVKQCEDWVIGMRGKYKNSTVATKVFFCRAMYEYAIDREYVLKNPFKKIVVSEPRKGRVGYVDIEKMNRFLEFCKTDKYGKKYYEMFYILFWTGLRVSELCSLTEADIDISSRTIRVWKQLGNVNGTITVLPLKTEKSRRLVPMTVGVAKCFEKILKDRAEHKEKNPSYSDADGNAYSGFLFMAPYLNRTISGNSVWRCLQRAVRRYNDEHRDEMIEPFGPHKCRHTFATNMQTLPIKTLQTILGHSNIRTTMDVYVGAEPIQSQLARVDEVVASIV